MSDVPQVDYDSQLQKLVEEFVYSHAPPKIKALLDDKSLHDYLRVGPVFVKHSGGVRYVYALGAGPGETHFTSPEAKKLIADSDSQTMRYRNTVVTLRAAFEGMRTAKQIAAAYPEFAKYLPEEVKPTKNLPALAGVVDALKRMGWNK